MATKSATIRDIIGNNISLTSLAKCLGISRPTLYKYMDAYDSKNIDLLPDNVLRVFDTVSTRVPKDKLQAYFNEMYANYIRMEERRLHENPVPPEIAEIVDSEELDVGDIDHMIEMAEKQLETLLNKIPLDEDEIEKVRKDLRDLEYTREMVEKRQAENHFLLIFSTNWTACIGPGEEDTVEYDEKAEIDVPDIDSKFRFFLARSRTGFTMFFYNQQEDDSVEVQILTGAKEDKTKDIVGTFRAEPGAKFIQIPDLFDEDYEALFQYRIVRSNGGRILNTAIGEFST